MKMNTPGLALFTTLLLSTPALAQSVNFGNNSSEYANDGECDDRRFIGQGMAASLDSDDNFHDANDCRHLYRNGLIKLWNRNQAKAATQCSALNFGDDTGEYARDGECDDPRFEGAGMSGVITNKDLLRDASDCRRMCDAGRIFLRSY